MENSILELLRKLNNQKNTGFILHHLKIYADGSGFIADQDDNRLAEWSNVKGEMDRELNILKAQVQKEENWTL